MQMCAMAEADVLAGGKSNGDYSVGDGRSDIESVTKLLEIERFQGGDINCY